MKEIDYFENTDIMSSEKFFNNDGLLHHTTKPAFIAYYPDGSIDLFLG